MTNLNNDNHQNLVSFLQHHQPIPPQSHPDLEQTIIDLLEPQSSKGQKRDLKFNWIISGASALRFPVRLIAMGFLFTSVSYGLRTPRIAVEPKDLEEFLVNNWQDTLGNNYYAAVEEAEAYWLLPTVSDPQPALSVSAQ